jgi:tRNA pseudouridine38-40 synthase
MRIALGIEYDGTSYNGWQRQKTGLGVQQCLEEALSRVANERVEVVCAGRTDTGVHASGQVIHFDTESVRSERGWLLGANTNLPEDISVTWVKPVDKDFHARFSAVARRYRYLILNRLQRSALYRQRAWWVYEPLDETPMQAAAQLLLGEHDFSAFRAAACQANTAVRAITDLSISRTDDWLRIDVTANAFLMNMVRNIVGTLVPHGLTLVGVKYPDAFGVPVAGCSRAIWI